MMLIQLKRNSGLAAALSAACRQPPPPPPPCSALLPECRFLHCQCHSHHQPLTYTRNSSIDLLKLEGAAIKHNNRKEMLRIENRSDQKQRTCSAAAALLRRRRQRVASSYIVCRGKSSLTSICSKHGLLLHRNISGRLPQSSPPRAIAVADAALQFGSDGYRQWSKSVLGDFYKWRPMVFLAMNSIFVTLSSFSMVIRKCCRL